MYSHRLIRFNYTTYDVRRAQDVVNHGTSHCNIMLLNKPTGDNVDEIPTSPDHPFLYARVIGIYHANVIYTGTGMINYNPTRFDFLWVRWYQRSMDDTSPRNRQSPYRLDRLSFPPIATEGAFGFVDPADVLRSCHIMPVFRQGKCGEENGMSTCARDSEDWNSYYIGRYVMQLVSWF